MLFIAFFVETWFFFSEMEKFLNIVNENLSAGEIDENNFKLFLGKIKIWEYAKISKQEYQNLSKDEQSSLLKLYYDDMLIRLDQESKFLLFFCLVLAQV